MEREVNPLPGPSLLGGISVADVDRAVAILRGAQLGEPAKAMVSPSRGGFTPDADGGMSEADVDRTVAILRRVQLAGRILVFFIAVGVGGLIGAVIAYRTGADMSGVPHA